MQRNFGLTLLIAFSALASPTASAQLGGTRADVDAVATFYSGSLTRTVERGSYRVHHITAPDLKIIEFISSTNGKVFAVAWEGTRTPALAPLLGSYSEELSAEMLHRHADGRARALSRGPAASLESDNLRVRRVGRPGFSQGIACLKNELPSGLESCDELH